LPAEITKPSGEPDEPVVDMTASPSADVAPEASAIQSMDNSTDPDPDPDAEVIAEPANGEPTPASVNLITDLSLDKRLHRALEKLGFSDATEVQTKAIPPALDGKDLMVSAKTGSGKTAAFVLPMLNRLLASEARNSGTRALILLPTRELALQTQKAFKQFAAFTHIKSGLIIGGEAFKYQIVTIRNNPEVLIATPGRLVDHIEKGTTDFSDLEVLILDEADRMLDMGFADDMNVIASACKAERQNLLFSATLEHRAIDRIKPILNDPLPIVIDSHRQAHSQIVQQKILADDPAHKEKLVTALIDEEQATRVFVFCNTREQCQQLGISLKRGSIKADFIHGEISQSERKQVMNRFRDGKLTVLVATDVAARGLDVPDVSMVINFNVAQNGDDHVHRIGRTGRAGLLGKAVTLVSANEWNLQSSIERYLKVRIGIRKIKGLEGTYTGPRKLKKSGKAAGTKKPKGGKRGKSKSASGKKPVKRKHSKRTAAPKRSPDKN
jgi:ATP-dependent RNA helicase SrmB